jgi:hypothetical protein
MNTFEMVRVTETVNGPTASTYDWSLPPGMTITPKLDMAIGVNKLTEDGTLELIAFTSVPFANGTVGSKISHTFVFKHV